jgi:hypothetical protein
MHSALRQSRRSARFCRIPPRLGISSVYELAGEHVGESAPYSRHEEDRSSCSGGNACNVGVVDQKEHRHQREREIVRRISTGIAEVLRCAEFGWCRLNLRRAAHVTPLVTVPGSPVAPTGLLTDAGVSRNNDEVDTGVKVQSSRVD